jgi:hypothetical protein
MIVTMDREQYLLFFAIEMWVRTFLILCDENGSSSHASEYSHFVASADEPQMKQVISDFYDYFYVQQHICDINHMRTLGEIDNNYGQRDEILLTTNSPNDFGTSNHKLRVLDLLKKIENNEQSKYVFQTITINVFQSCCLLRKDLGLPIFDDKEQDENLVSYFTRKSA